MNGCVVCDERGCEFCPGVFASDANHPANSDPDEPFVPLAMFAPPPGAIIDRDPGDETTAVTDHRDPNTYVLVSFRFPHVGEANEFLRNIQKFPHYVQHHVALP